MTTKTIYPAILKIEKSENKQHDLGCFFSRHSRKEFLYYNVSYKDVLEKVISFSTFHKYCCFVEKQTDFDKILSYCKDNKIDYSMIAYDKDFLYMETYLNEEIPENKKNYKTLEIRLMYPFEIVFRNFTVFVPNENLTKEVYPIDSYLLAENNKKHMKKISDDIKNTFKYVNTIRKIELSAMILYETVLYYKKKTKTEFSINMLRNAINNTVFEHLGFIAQKGWDTIGNKETENYLVYPKEV